VSGLGTFLGVSILIIVTPGPDTALTIRNALLGGRRGGFFTALGVATGQATWTLATSAGVAALLLASEPAFRALRVLGAAYLVFLGAQALRAAVQRPLAGRATVGTPAGRTLAPWTAYRQGVISNLANPKMAVFFTSLLPQFTAEGETSFWTLLPLGLVFCSLTLVWLTAYASAVAKAGDLLRRPRIRRILEGLTGIALIGLGLRIASQKG
jgi:threonine/homoserine/homoserine lactone efflux protein